MEAGARGRHELIRRMYEAYNTCDLQRLIGFMSNAVDWPDGEARLHGPPAVKDYWLRLWSRVRIHDEVVGITDAGPGRTVARISQVIRDLGGEVVSTGTFEHTYSFHEGLVLRMDLRELQPEKELKIMDDETDFVRTLYAAFNQRDIPAAVALMHPEVSWANGQDGGHVQGRDAIRAYWTKQWAAIQPHVDPLDIKRRAEDVTVVEVHQVVHDIGGKLLLDETVRHVFHTQDGLVIRFDIENAGGLSSLSHN